MSSGEPTPASALKGGSETPEPPVEELVALYRKQRDEIGAFLANVRTVFEQAATPEVRALIHSTRWRLKDEDHLADKIKDKRLQSRRITLENFFEQVEDLAGLRVITLYRWDFPALDLFIRSSHFWTVKKCDPWAWMPDDVTRMKEAGLDPKDNGRRYTSIHYILGAAGHHDAPWLRCEVQVRSLHLEGCEEVDHRLRYPRGEPGPVAAMLLDILRQAASVADFLAHAAKDAGDVHAKTKAEHAAFNAKISTLQRQLDTAVAKKDPVAITTAIDALVGVSRPEPWSIEFNPYLTSYGAGGFSGTFAWPTNTFSTPVTVETCALCGRSAASDDPTSLLYRCQSCNRMFCRACAGESRETFVGIAPKRCRACRA